MLPLAAAAVEWSSGSSSLSSLSLCDCIEQAKLLLLNSGGYDGDDDDALVLSVFEGLFRKVSATGPFSMGIEDDENTPSEGRGCRTHMLAIDQVIELMVANSGAKSVVLEAFIRHIAALPSHSMLPFIDAIPAMFRRSDSRMIEDLAGVLFSIIEDPSRRDRSEILLRLLHALSQLPLSKPLAHTVMNLTYLVMEDAAPAEMCDLLRIVLRSGSSPNAGRAIFMWRDKLSRIPTEDLSPVIDRLWDIIPQCTGGAAILLEQIVSQEQRLHSYAVRANKEKVMPLSDLAIASIILCRVSSLITPTRDLLRRCVLLDRMPIHSLTLLLLRGDEVGKRVGRVLWDLCVSLLDQSIALVEGAAAEEDDAGKLLSQQRVLNNSTSKLSRLVGSLYSSCPALQDAIVIALLSRCLPSMALYYNARISSCSTTSASTRRRATNDNNDDDSGGGGGGNLIRDVLPLGRAFASMSGRQDPCMQSSTGGSKRKAQTCSRSDNNKNNNSSSNNNNNSSSNNNNNKSSSPCEAVMRQTAAHYRACLAACLLRDLSAAYDHDQDHHHAAAAAVGPSSAVRSSLLARLDSHISAAAAMGSRRRQQQMLPAPFITATLMDCAVMGVSHRMERSSFIATIHELLALDVSSRGTTSSAQLALDNLFGRSSRIIPIEGHRAGLTRDAAAVVAGAGMAHKAVCSSMHPSPAMGVILACKLLLRWGIDESSASLLSGVVQCSSRDDCSLLSAIDGLSACLHSAVMLSTQDVSLLLPCTLFCNALSSCLHRLSLSSRIVTRMRSSGGTTTARGDATAATVGGLRSFWLSNELRVSPEYDEAASDAAVEGRSEAARRCDGPIAWDLADLSSTMARTTATLSRMQHDLPGEGSSTQSSMVALSSTLFHLMQKVSFSHYLVASMRSHAVDKEHWDTSSAVKLSFQMAPGDDDSSSSSCNTTASSGCGEFLSSDLSTRLLVTWSAAAAGAFKGDSSYALPAGLTATQALMLAWERGLLVAVQAGRLAALRVPLTDNCTDDCSLLVKPLLVLLCQLHSCRLMLRAGASRGLGRSRRGIVQSTGPSRSRDDSRTELLDRGKRAVLQLHEELEAIQRVSLQRLLRRSLVTDIPVRLVLIALQCVLKPIDDDDVAAAVASPAASSDLQRSQRSMLSDHGVSSRLRTDAGLSIVSLYLYREVMRKRDQHGAAAMLSSNHSFISVLRPDDEDESSEQLNAALCTTLLSTLPSMLSALEESRLRRHHRDRGKRSKDAVMGGGVGCREGDGRDVDVLEGCFGNGLDRYGLKILILLLLKLLEMKVATMHADSAAALANRMVLTINSAAHTTAMGPGREAALHAIYHILERHLLPQHDATITAVGVRVLSDLIRSAGHGPSTAHRRVGSLAWRSFRSVYSESVDIGLHLHHLSHGGALCGLDDDAEEAPPGMDDMWTQLVDLVSRQTMSDRAALELTQLCDKSSLGAVGLMNTCFSTHNEVRWSMRPNCSSDQLRDCMAYRQLWLYWWVAESTNQRVYGVALLLQEVLRCLCSGGAVDGAGSSPASELHANSRVRSMKAAEYMLQHSHSSSSATCSTTVVQWFPFVSPSTVEFHLQLTLSLLPALLILSSPPPVSTCTPSPPPLHTPFNPYVNLIHVCMLTVWTFDAFTDIVVEQQQFLGLVVNLSHQIFKVVRCVLNGSLLAVTRMVEWRARQPLQLDTAGGYSCCRDGSAPPEDINDPGSMHYLQHAIRWAISAVKHVASFVDAFRRVMVLSGQFDAPRSLVKALPGIQSLIERTSGHLIQLCHVNSADISPRHDPTGTHPSDLETADPPVTVRAKKRALSDQARKIGRVGDKEMQMRMKQFLDMHDKRLSEPLVTEDGSAFDGGWDPLPATTDAADARGSMMESVAGGSMDWDEESDPQFGFIPAEKGALSTNTHHASSSSSSSASGWGLYEAAEYGREDEQGHHQHNQWSGSMSDKDSSSSYETSGSIGSEDNI